MRRVSTIGHQMTRLLLKQTINRQCSNSLVDVINVCDNIVFAHRSRAYKGKPSLWVFMVDVNKSLNKSKKRF